MSRTVKPYSRNFKTVLLESGLFSTDLGILSDDLIMDVFSRYREGSLFKDGSVNGIMVGSSRKEKSYSLYLLTRKKPSRAIIEKWCVFVLGTIFGIAALKSRRT